MSDDRYAHLDKKDAEDKAEQSKFNRGCLATAIGLALVIGICSYTGQDDNGTDRPVVTDSNVRTVTSTDFGEEWPLTVDEGALRCSEAPPSALSPDTDRFAVTFTADGTTYAVNGTAKDEGLPDIDPIWADDPTVDGLKKNIQPLIAAGLDLC